MVEGWQVNSHYEDLVIVVPTRKTFRTGRITPAGRDLPRLVPL
jgi:hypothetical protein